MNPDINITIESIPNNKLNQKQIRNRFVIQLITTFCIVGFCIYSIISTGKLPEKDNIIYCLFGGISTLWIPPPKLYK
jgi:hypothetical protein